MDCGITAQYFNIQIESANAVSHLAACLASELPWIHRIGHHNVAEGEILLRDLACHMITHAAYLRIQEATIPNGLFDGIGPHVNGAEFASKLARNGSLSNTGQAREYHKHRG